MMLIAAFGSLAIALAIRRRRARSAASKRNRELDADGTVLSRMSTIEMAHNPLWAARAAVTTGFAEASPDIYQTVEPPPPGPGAEISAAAGAYVLPDPGQPAVYDAARNSIPRPAGYAKPSFAYVTTTVPIPEPAQLAQHGAARYHGTTEATDYPVYQVRGAAQAMDYAAYQVVSAPKADAGANSADHRRAKDNQGDVAMPNYAIVAPANGHVYAIPTDTIPMEEKASNA